MRPLITLFITGMGLMLSSLSIIAQESDDQPDISCCQIYLFKDVAFVTPDVFPNENINIIEYGISWSVTPIFDSTVNRIPVQYYLNPYPDLPASKITGLKKDSTYYIRGYAISSAGTVYSQIESFTVTWEPDIHSDLIACYPFDGNATDASGNNHHGTCTGTTPAADRFGKAGGALSFNGEKNTLSFKGFPLTGDAVTITAWIKPNEKSTDTLFVNTIPRLFTVLLRVADHRYELDISSGNQKRVFTDIHHYSNVDPERPRFDFLALVLEKNSVRFYLNNNTLVDEPLNIPLVNFDILKFAPKDPEFRCKGILDEVRIYSRILSFDDILELQGDRPHTAPVITADYVSAGSDIASVHSTINYDPTLDITETGVCWSTSPHPDTLENKVVSLNNTVEIFSTISGLLSGTTYYVRSYAINSVGIGYSNELSFTTTSPVSYGSVSDIDGNQYKTVRIGTQTWMAENLKTTRYADGTPMELGRSYFIYNNDPDFKDDYGLLYDWHAATNTRGISQSYPGGVQGACPVGWHIPNYAELKYLIKYLGSDAGGKLKETGLEHWNYPNAGATNASGFSARGAGFRKFVQWDLIDTMKNNVTYFWSSEYEPGIEFFYAYRLGVNYNNDHAGISTLLTDEASSVRCLKDTAVIYVEKPLVTTKKVTGVTHDMAVSGGIITYNGEQLRNIRGVCWNTSPHPDTSDFKTTEPYKEDDYASASWNYTSILTELLPDTTYYVRAYAASAAGVSYGEEYTFHTLPDLVRGTVKDIEGNTYKTVMIGTQNWMAENLNTTKLNDGTPLTFVTGPFIDAPSYYVMHNDTSYRKVYGLLYNSHTILTQKICPSGWHLPDSSEWMTLVRFLGDSTGDKMKEAGFRHWPGTNKNATNISGFTALPGNMQQGVGDYYKGDVFGAFWSSSNLMYWFVTSKKDSIFIDIVGEGGGVSVRCLENGKTNPSEKITSVLESGIQSIGFYPNPAGDALYFRNLPENVQISVYNLKGRIVIRTFIQKGELDISSLKRGTYLLEFSNDAGKITRKFVKE